METPTCHVVICHHTGRTLLERCLASVFASQGVSYTVTVVSSDPTWRPHDSRIRHLFVEGGPAHKRNVAVWILQTPSVVFLDDDVEISPYCLWELCQWLANHPRCGIAFSKIYKMEEGRRDEFDDCGSWLTQTGFLFARAGNRQVDGGQYNQPIQCLGSKSATCGVRLQAFMEAGRFDRDYYILGEETDLAWRMWLKGWEAWYVPTATSWHAFGCGSLKPTQDFYTLERIHFHGCKNYVGLLFTNLGTPRLLGILPLHVVLWMLAAALFWLGGGEGTNRARFIWKGLWWNVTNWKSLWKKRHQVQSTRVIRDRDLLPLVMAHPPVRYYGERLTRYLIQRLHG